MRNDLPPARRPEEMERNAYNAAFYELGLRWHWDSATWAALQCRGADCVRHYLETEQPRAWAQSKCAPTPLPSAVRRASTFARSIACTRKSAS